jgi:hypothetical protein
MLFATSEIVKISILPEGGAIIHATTGCEFHVASRYPELVVKEAPRRTGPDAGYQFSRYEKLVEP